MTDRDFDERIVNARIQELHNQMPAVDREVYDRAMREAEEKPYNVGITISMPPLLDDFQRLAAQQAHQAGLTAVTAQELGRLRREHERMVRENARFREVAVELLTDAFFAAAIVAGTETNHAELRDECRDEAYERLREQMEMVQR